MTRARREWPRRAISRRAWLECLQAHATRVEFNVRCSRRGTAGGKRRRRPRRDGDNRRRAMSAESAPSRGLAPASIGGAWRSGVCDRGSRNGGSSRAPAAGGALCKARLWRAPSGMVWAPSSSRSAGLPNGATVGVRDRPGVSDLRMLGPAAALAGAAAPCNTRPSGLVYPGYPRAPVVWSMATKTAEHVYSDPPAAHGNWAARRAKARDRESVREGPATHGTASHAASLRHLAPQVGRSERRRGACSTWGSCSSLGPVRCDAHGLPLRDSAPRPPRTQVVARIRPHHGRRARMAGNASAQEAQ